ncbi:BTAD domain-containing putative transcriptional regulator [Streptomyces sp. S.PB5]|uniref:AfsR/SARP family transcriptional regulator n=1 Tax=Streptomyces sp. S.PB5 TaxID=3020844 RepID=UPI0025B0F5E7|nr:BTAD domain-containing putative transcriptional regulator [Streptomyces sp. S.PB5]MDN3026313.1 BTAD domain-containing putative transcriptional regulator [Streptomyces sp. S.PB5]
MKRCELRFGLLGTPVLYDAGTARVVNSPKVRALLAALLLEADRTVPVEELKDALWGGAPPASAQASLHNHVTRLRRLLDAPERLRAVPPGYRLRVEQGELDVHVFDAHVSEARAAHAGRDWERTLRACTDGLGLWRGAPLSGLPAELGGYAFGQRLREARLLLLEWRYDAELAVGTGRLDTLVPELTALAAEHPLRESFHRQLMLALHRTGRQAEALAVHRDLRTRLVEELGVEPGAGVRGAHVEVLRGAAEASGAADSGLGADSGEGEGEGAGTGEGTGAVAGNADALGAGTAPPGAGTDPLDEGTAPLGAGTGPLGEGMVAGAGNAPLTDANTRPASADPTPDVTPAETENPPTAPPAAPSTTPPSTPPRPAQLPPPPLHFTGRAATLDDLRRTLTATDGHTPVAVVSGMAGVGKSALALHAAHGLRDRFPDGQLYVNLHGATPGMTPLTPAQALTALLRDLGADPCAIPEHPDASAALLRSTLAPSRTLLVLDDAASAAQVRQLLPAGPGCAVIVTSRSPLTALDGARRFPLAPLSAEDSAALLRAVSGREGPADREAHGGPGPGPGEAHSGPGPGTGTGTGTRTPAADPNRIDATHPLVELTGRLPLALRIVAARLAARRALTPDVLADQLAATDDRLGHLEYDDLSVRRSLAVAHDALAASGRRTDRDAALALRRLGALDLPTYGAPLIARLLGTETGRAEAALDRLVDVALLEETAYGRYAPHDLVRDFARGLTDAGHAPDVARTAVRWYTALAERTLTAIVEPDLDQDDRRRPTAAQPPEHAAHVLSVPAFASSEDAFAWASSELENIVALVERYADAPDDRTAAHVATLLRLFFPYLQRGGRVSEMEVLGQAALRLARRFGDEVAEAYALVDLAGLRFLTGRHSESLALTDDSLALWRRLGVLSRIRRCLGNRGLLLENLGRYEESGAALRQSLELSRQLDDPWGEAVTYGHLGNLYEHTDPRAAIEQHRRSLAIGAEIGNVIVQHSAHCNIGYAHLTLGEPAAAVPHFEESRRILGGHGDWHGESQSRLGLVRALRLLGRTERAESECAELLRRADARADRYTAGLARHQYGLLLQESGRAEAAYDQWRAALVALDGTDRKEVLAELHTLLGD